MATGIFKRGDTYWIRYSFNGKQVRESSNSKSFKDASLLLATKMQAVLEGKQPELRKVQRTKFSELIEKYLQSMQDQRAIRSKSLIANQIAKVLGNKYLDEFNTQIVETYQKNLAANHKPATANRHLAVIKHAFTKAEEWEMVSSEVARKVKRVKLLKEYNRRLRYLSKEECQTLISNCDAHLRPVVITALNTGMRKEEILGLKWENIDLKHGFILLSITKNGERREVPISDELSSTLSGIVRRLDCPFVFNANGVRFVDIRKSFAKALRRSGIADFHFHDLRHTVASHLVMSGIDLPTVKEILGHKSLSMTMRYSHLAPSHMVKAINVLSSVVNQ